MPALGAAVLARLSCDPWRPRAVLSRNVPWPGTGSARAYVTATQNRTQKKLHKRHNLRLRRPSVPDRVMMAYYLVSTQGAEKWIYLNRCGKYSYSLTLKINSLKEGFIMTIEWAHNFIPFIPLPSTAKCVLSNAPINCPLPRNARHAASDSARACKK